METSIVHESHVTTPHHDVNKARQPTATLFTAFGTGRSYLFHVEKRARARVQECWEEVFSGQPGWSFEKLKNYDKPLGETAIFTLNEENCLKAASPLEELRKACESTLSAELDGERIEVIFFTTGVAILMLRMRPKDPADVRFFDRLQDQSEIKEIRKWLNTIMGLCKDHYLYVLNKTEVRQGASEEKRWSLNRFKVVDREGWNPKEKFSYPLFFVDQDTYENRIEKILGQVAGSKWQRKRQSDAAKVSYKGAEVYVDWSEALVTNSVDNRELVERNFIIAFASWFALILMNKNSSIFLFQAFVGMIKEKPQSTANAVHQRRMAYMDVADAVLPIRWTSRRSDLFLLETIHRNWSSQRWKENIEERMKLLAMHYNSLEDEQNERSGRYLSLIAIFITLFALASAIADVISLAENDGGNSYWLILGFPMKVIDLHLSLVIPLLTGMLLVTLLWLRSKLR